MVWGAGWAYDEYEDESRDIAAALVASIYLAIKLLIWYNTTPQEPEAKKKTQ